MIHINIEIQKPNRFKDFSHKFFNKLEDTMFSIIQKVPEQFIPHFLMTWLEHYTNKRIAELQHQIIRDRWRNVELENVVNKIHSN